jgi:hypothetical protein
MFAVSSLFEGALPGGAATPKRAVGVRGIGARDGALTGAAAGTEWIKPVFAVEVWVTNASPSG